MKEQEISVQEYKATMDCLSKSLLGAFLHIEDRFGRKMAVGVVEVEYHPENRMDVVLRLVNVGYNKYWMKKLFLTQEQAEALAQWDVLSDSHLFRFAWRYY